jgi:hypothetical protein
MRGHHRAWDYGWQFFLIALDEAVKHATAAESAT